MDKYQIHQSASLREALLKIESNQSGIVFVTDCDQVVIAVATDGDIRRKLLDGSGLDASIGSCANPDFIWAQAGTSRENLLKKLDHQIRVVPILNNQKQLISVVTRDHLPLEVEGRIYARSRSPVRISFGGGGSDLTHYFAEDESAAVINATINMYSHAVLRIRDDESILIHSLDLNSSLSGISLQDILSKKGDFGLIQSILKLVQPQFGFELYLHSDFPIGSGLGGSAVLTASILGCFNQFRRDKWDLHELAELAYQAERLYFGIAGGWQDQYATVFGGLNFMEFKMEQNIVHPLRLPIDVLHELEESLILCDSGCDHNSGEIHQDQYLQMQQKKVQNKIQSNVNLAYTMRNQLLRGQLLEFGKSLNDAWQLKRQFSDKISNSYLDQIYQASLENGAVGGKLLGAGGGGFFLFFALPFNKHKLISWLNSQRLKVYPFRFDLEGLNAWSSRDVSEQK